MEGGYWGLVIIFAAFMIQVLTFGATAAIGVYNMELLEYFEGATIGVSLIGSINYGIFLGSGPIVSFLMTKFSYRQITLFGSLLTVIGLLGMPVLPFIPAMCICFGLLTGFGCCCCYIPSHVLSGLYYDKYRSLATGVTTSGSGLGGAILPIVVGLLIEHYSWKGSLIFVAGLCLNLFVFSCLLRSPPAITVAEKEIILSNGEDESEAKTNLISLHKATKDDSCDCQRESQNIVNLDSPSYRTNRSSVESMPLYKRKEDTKMTNCALKSIADIESNVSFLEAKQPFLLNHLSSSLSSLQAVGATRGSSVLVIDQIGHCDVQASGQTAESLADKPPKSSRHVYIFTHCGFNIYFFSNLMWNAGCSIVNSFAPEFLRERGISPINAAYLFGGYGFGCFIGGILGGVLGNLKCVNRQAFYIASNLLIGFILIIFPFYDNLIFYTVCLVVSGIFFGVILGLLIIVLTDLIGVESLGNGLGYLMLSNGVGTFIGPPLAGLIKDGTGGFEGGMILSGVLFLLGGIIMLIMPCKHFSAFNKCSPEKKH